MREADEPIVAENPLYLRARPPSMSDNLHAAVEKGNIAKMQQLLAGGADVNEKNVRCARCPLSSLPVPPPWHASRRRMPPSAAHGRSVVSPTHHLPTADPIACPRVASTRALVTSHHAPMMRMPDALGTGGEGPAIWQAARASRGLAARAGRGGSHPSVGASGAMNP